VDEISAKTKARYNEHISLAAKWYMNTQCTNDNPWGGIRNQADDGRFVYEVYKATHWSRAMGVWGQALAIMDLLDIADRSGSKAHERAGLNGVRYLLALQCMDYRYPECQGAFWEHVPSGPMSWIRDSATACFGLNRLYLYTGDKEYLDRAKLWSDWFMKYGSKDEYCWPYSSFDFVARVAHSKAGAEIPGMVGDGDGEEEVDGDWQAGCGLALYQVAMLSGEEKYAEEGLKPMLEKVLNIYEEHGDNPNMAGWHGQNPITLGNDDFVFVALAAGWRDTD